MQYGVWYTKGVRVGTRSSKCIWVEANSPDEAIDEAERSDNKPPREYVFDRVVGPY